MIGVDEVGENEDEVAINDLELTFDFSGGTVHGDAYNSAFYVSNGSEQISIGRDLEITGGPRSVTSTGFTARASGDLIDAGDTIGIDGMLEGEFYEYGYFGAKVGDLNADLTTPDGTDTAQGGFAAYEVSP
ncbi:hypothetical protein [Celeribacter sp.]|uniref:hypothetical protein n=1 Tax=Celeribacter sp. TaxID=1890673 RepID=UPI003A8D5DEC